MNHGVPGSVRNKGLTIGCYADNQTGKVGCPHPKSGIQSVFDKHRALLANTQTRKMDKFEVKNKMDWNNIVALKSYFWLMCT